MLKYLLFAALIACTRAEDLDTQDQLYIVAGILGGVCLLLTIISIYNAVTLINVQTKIKLLQSAGSAAVKAVADVAAESQQYAEVSPSRDPPPSQGYARPHANRPPPPRDNYRMDRIGTLGNYTYASDLAYNDGYPGNYRRPAPPARPGPPERRDMYY